MKVKSSGKSLIKRAIAAGGYVARRRGRVFICCKKKPSFKARLG